MSNNSNLGPLPKADHNQELQELSFRALQRALPPNSFIIRDERIHDAGVDLSLELLIDGYYTNMRAQVQLKSTESTKSNNDGSFSLSVDTSNINYLLNGQSPLYVIYLVERNELRYIWVRDERKRLDIENPQWFTQDSNTLRFREVLNAESLQQIHTRIYKEARLHRDIHDVLTSASASEYITVSIKPEDLTRLDTENLQDLLLKGGITLVNSGYASQILESIDLLPSKSRREPRILLLRACAEYITGDYQSALGSIGKSLINQQSLSDNDHQIADYVKTACEYALGIISTNEYVDRQENYINNAQGLFALNYKLAYLRRVLSEESSEGQRKKALQELRNLVAAAEKEEAASESFRLQAQIELLYEEGKIEVQNSLDRLSTLTVHQKMGYQINIDLALSSEIYSWNAWMQRAEEILQRSQKQGNSILIGEAILMWSKVIVARLMVHKFQHYNTLPNDLTIVKPEQLITPLRQAISAFQETNSQEGEIRAKLALADIYMLLGNEELAQELAAQSLPIAKAMGYIYLQIESESLIMKNSVWHRAENFFTQLEIHDEDIIQAQASDDDLRQFSQRILDSLGLPKVRLPIIEKEARSVRAIAQEKLNWCEFIELTQDTRHTASKESLYQIDPERSGWCKKFNYRSHIKNKNWKLVIQVFKETYCKSCISRSPKVKS